MNSSVSRSFILPAVIAVLALSAAAPAVAGTTTTNIGVLSITEKYPGEVNDLTVTVPPGGNVLRAEEYLLHMTPTAPCVQGGDFRRVDCPGASADSVAVDLGEGSDLLDLRVHLPSVVVGDDGNDTVYASYSDDELTGNEGNDDLEGKDGDDFLADGSAVNGFYGFGGNDAFFGGNGDDTLDGGALPGPGVGGDVLSGG